MRHSLLIIALVTAMVSVGCSDRVRPSDATPPPASSGGDGSSGGAGASASGNAQASSSGTASTPEEVNEFIVEFMKDTTTAQIQMDLYESLKDLETIKEAKSQGKIQVTEAKGFDTFITPADGFEIESNQWRKCEVKTSDDGSVTIIVDMQSDDLLNRSDFDFVKKMTAEEAEKSGIELDEATLYVYQQKKEKFTMNGFGIDETSFSGAMNYTLKEKGFNTSIAFSSFYHIRDNNPGCEMQVVVSEKEIKGKFSCENTIYHQGGLMDSSKSLSTEGIFRCERTDI